jgi:hypothetical protein
VKTLAIAAATCALLAVSANAAPFAVTAPANPPLVQLTHGNDRGGGGWGGGGGRGSAVGVVVDVPLAGAGYGNSPVHGPSYYHCREARNICFESWGIDGRRYGRCMWRLGC